MGSVFVVAKFNLVSKSTSEFHWPSQYWGPLYRGGYSCSGQSQVLSDIIHFLAPHSRVRMRTSDGLSRFAPGWGIMRQNSFDIIAPLHIWSLKILKVKINKLTLNRNLIFMFQLNFDRVFTRGFWVIMSFYFVIKENSQIYSLSNSNIFLYRAYLFWEVRIV